MKRAVGIFLNIFWGGSVYIGLFLGCEGVMNIAILLTWFLVVVHFLAAYGLFAIPEKVGKEYIKWSSVRKIENMLWDLAPISFFAYAGCMHTSGWLTASCFATWIGIESVQNHFKEKRENGDREHNEEEEQEN